MYTHAVLTTHTQSSPTSQRAKESTQATPHDNRCTNWSGSQSKRAQGPVSRTAHLASVPLFICARAASLSSSPISDREAITGPQRGRPIHRSHRTVIPAGESTEVTSQIAALQFASRGPAGVRRGEGRRWRRPRAAWINVCCL